LALFREEKADGERQIAENQAVLDRAEPELEATKTEITSVEAEIEQYNTELAGAEATRAA
jgi:phage shock protein A